MDMIHLTNTIFKSDSVPFTNWDSSFYIIDGFFYVYGMYDEFDDSYTLMCFCYDELDDTKTGKMFFLKYSDFNRYVIQGNVVYYSHRRYTSFLETSS